MNRRRGFYLTLAVMACICMVLPVQPVQACEHGDKQSLCYGDLPKVPRNWAWEVNQDPMKVPLDFQVDLDVLAPLGKEEGNAADFFKDFSKAPVGSRRQEWEKIKERETTWEHDGRENKILPADANPDIAKAAAWSLEAPFNQKLLEDILKEAKKH